MSLLIQVLRKRVLGRGGAGLCTFGPSNRKASQILKRMSLTTLSTNTTRNQLKVMREKSTLCCSKWAWRRGNFSLIRSLNTR